MFKLIILAGFIIFVLKAGQSVQIEEEKVIHQLGYEHLDWMHENGIQCPEVVVAQICLETKYLTSKIYKQNNNLFGMKQSPKDTFCIGTNLGHAAYSIPAHSILAYRDWQRRRFPNRTFKSNEEYIYALGHLFKRVDGSWARYAEDKDYEKKINKIIQTLYKNE